MEIIFLGTGGCMPSLRRNLPSIALRMDSGKIMLFDCGEGTQRQILRAPMTPMSIERIFISHLHCDHFLGIFGLLQTMNMNSRKERIEIYGPVGISFIQELLNVRFFRVGFEVLIRELKPDEVLQFDGYSVITAGTEHGVPCLAYAVQEDDKPGRFNLEKALALGIPPSPLYSRLQHGETVMVDGRQITPNMVLGEPRRGRRVVYSGDTRPCDSVAELAKSADVLIHESSLSRDDRKFMHSTPAEAAGIAKKAGVKKLFLFHLSPRYDMDDREPGRQAAGIFRNSEVSRDLHVYRVYQEG